MLMELCRLSTVMMAFLVFAYIAWVDCRTLEIPDRCHLILIGLACVQMVCGGSLPLETRGLGLVAISLPMMLANLLRKDSFGGGDIKMCGAAGFLMGAPLMAAGALMGMLLAGLYAGFAVMLKIKKPKDAFALGPFLSIGFATSMLGGPVGPGILMPMVFLVNQKVVWYCRAMDEKIKTIEMNPRTAGMVAVALFPALVVAIYIFGIQAAWLSLTCVVSCVLAEAIFQVLASKKVTIKDGSAAVTGLILSFALPADFPLWMAMVGCLAAIVLAKQLFGGAGNNFLNPAAAGIVFLQVSFSEQMNQFPYPLLAASIDGQAASTPLQMWLEGRGDEIPSYIEMFLGFVSGGLGEVSALALLIGAIFLWYKRVLSPVTPLAYIGTVALTAWLLPGQDPVFHVLAGGTLFAAIFMTGDKVTVPETVIGKLMFGIGCGLLTMLIRMAGTPMEGVAFAIIFMNIVTPYIDRIPKINLKKRGNPLTDAGEETK